MAVALLVKEAQSQSNVECEVVAICPGQVGVKVDEVGVEGTVLVVLNNKIRDGSGGIDGVTMEALDLWARAAQLVEQADLSFDGVQVTKGLPDLDILVVPSSSVDVTEAARDVGVVDDTIHLLKGNIRRSLLKDLQNVLCGRHVLHGHLDQRLVFWWEKREI